MRTEGWILGCDPDSVKSGFALLNCATRSFEFVGALSFPEAIKFMDGLAASDEYKGIILVMEDSNTSTNWHLNYLVREPMDTMKKLRIAAATGRNVGKCHATAEHLQEYAESVGIEVRLQKPLVKCWKGKDRKITQEEITSFISGLPNRMNQECRDSVLLSWTAADFPIRISMRK